MKRILLAITAVVIASSASADTGDRDRRGNDNRGRQDDRRDDRGDGRRDDRHDNDRDNRRGDRDNRRGDRHDNNRDDRYGRDERRHDGNDIWKFLIPVIVGANNGHGGGYGSGPVPYGTIRCESINGLTRYCYTGLRQITHVRLVRQYSKAACVNRGNNYYDTYTAVNGNIVVRNGCRGEFVVYGR